MIRSDQQTALAGGFRLLGRAMVIEQNPRDLRAYAGMLRGMGFDVKAFANYQDASRCLEMEPADFILVNQGSAAFDARGIVERALAHDRHTPVVVVTQCLDMGCYLEAMQLGAVDYVEKPLTPAEMEHLVTTHCRPRLLQVPHIAER